MKKIIKTSVIVAMSVLSFNAAAEKTGDGQIAAKVSTMGFGIEYNHPVNSVLSIGFGVNKFSKNESLTESDIKYQGDVDFQSASIIANYHPWENGFRLRGGVYYNNNKISLTTNSSTNNNIKIDNTSFTGADIALDGDLSFKKFAPYIGIGYGSEPIGDNNLSFDFDIGVMNSPVKAQLAGTCVDKVANRDICTASDFNGKLAKEQADLEESTDGFDLYPVISLGLSYRF